MEADNGKKYNAYPPLTTTVWTHPSNSPAHPAPKKHREKNEPGFHWKSFRVISYSKPSSSSQRKSQTQTNTISTLSTPSPCPCHGHFTTAHSPKTKRHPRLRPPATQPTLSILRCPSLYPPCAPPKTRFFSHCHYRCFLRRLPPHAIHLSVGRAVRRRGIPVGFAVRCVPIGFDSWPVRGLPIRWFGGCGVFCESHALA